MSYQPFDHNPSGPHDKDNVRARGIPRNTAHRTGLLLGAGLALSGIALALSEEAVASPALLVVGWLLIAWSTHRVGRSGPLFDWPNHDMQR